MKIVYRIQIVTMILFLISCQNNKLADDIQKMQSRPIDLSSCEGAFCYKNGEITTYNKDTAYRLVVYLDSLSCSSCFISHMHEYKKIIEEFDSVNIRTVVLFEPKQKQKEEVKFLLEQQAYPFLTIVVDNCAFSKDNPHLPASSVLHSFLLNKKNEVVIAGNPVRNTQIKDLMLSSVKRRGCNDNR